MLIENRKMGAVGSKKQSSTWYLWVLICFLASVPLLCDYSTFRDGIFSVTSAC